MRKSSLLHYCNPLHLYCRLIDLGLPKSWAMWIGVLYERTIFKKLRKKDGAV